MTPDERAEHLVRVLRGHDGLRTVAIFTSRGSAEPVRDRVEPEVAAGVAARVRAAVAAAITEAVAAERERLAKLADEANATYEQARPDPDGIPAVWVHPFGDRIRAVASPFQTGTPAGGG